MNTQNNKKESGSEARASDRMIYLAVALMLVVMAAVIGISAATRKKATTLPASTTAPRVTAATTARPATTAAPRTTAAPAVTDAPTAAELPTLSAPLDGTLIKGYSHDELVRSVTMNDYRVHSGIDIAAAEGSAVVACCDGIVSEVWFDPMMGRCVSIAHAGGIVTVMMNLDETLADGIAPGREVACGELVGAVGCTAIVECAEVPHLHLEITRDGKTEDPLSYFLADVFAEEGTQYED